MHSIERPASSPSTSLRYNGQIICFTNVFYVYILVKTFSRRANCEQTFSFHLNEHSSTGASQPLAEFRYKLSGRPLPTAIKSHYLWQRTRSCRPKFQQLHFDHQSPGEICWLHGDAPSLCYQWLSLICSYPTRCPVEQWGIRRKVAGADGISCGSRHQTLINYLWV